MNKIMLDKFFNASLTQAAKAYNKGEAGKLGFITFYNHVNKINREGGSCGACTKRARLIVSEAFLLRQL